MASLLIRMIVRVADNERGPGIQFGSWLPRESSAIEAGTKNLMIRLWTDVNCVAAFQRMTEEHIPKVPAIHVHRMCLAAALNNVPEEVAQHIMGEKKRQEMEADYEQLGELVYDATLRLVNRLLVYARSELGQHWLNLLTPDQKNRNQFFLGSEARVSVDGSRWTLWDPPPRMGHITVTVDSGERAMSLEAWERAGLFVIGNERNYLPLELIGNAEQLAREEHVRAAIVEAVAALEVAVKQFAARADINQLVPLGARPVDPRQIAKTIEQSGLRVATKIILPVLLTESQLASNTLKECQAACDLRNDVVHNSKRIVDKRIVNRYCGAIRAACHALRKLTRKG